jgi:formamidopyrimidine-DNA glycosylase
MAFTGWIIPDWAENSSPRKFLHPVDLKHTRMLFNTDRGKIHWVDPRLLSKLFIFKDVESVKNSHYLSDMGPDCESLRAYLKLGESREKESRKIRDLLLDQRFIAGIGNYLCSEILHAAKVQPRKRLKEFSPDEVIELYRTIKEVLERARTEETKDWWKVFGRKICGDCGGPVTREAWGNRGHYICPNCVNTQLK